MYIGGEYFNDVYLNRLLQISIACYNPRLVKLLDKPAAWSEAMKSKPKAIKSLRYEILKPIPCTLLRGLCQDYCWARQNATHRYVDTIRIYQAIGLSTKLLLDSFTWLDAKSTNQYKILKMLIP